jgi:FdhD protein
LENLKSSKHAQVFQVNRFKDDALESVDDLVAVEAPLQISIAFGKGKDRQIKQLVITMRTPGSDSLLARGFLFTEGIISQNEDILMIKQLEEHHVLVELEPTFELDESNIDRNFYMTSSCGVCGKSSIDQVHQHSSFLAPNNFQIPISTILALPDKLKIAQKTFQQTGGLHAAALFVENGILISIKEDVGRHNAADKLIGELIKDYQDSCQKGILLLSGRASFELIQKAAMARISIVASIGAPSSLAVELAIAHKMCLIGFVKNNGCNIYSSKTLINFS